MIQLGRLLRLVVGYGLTCCAAASAAPVVNVEAPVALVRDAEVVLSGTAEDVVRLLVDGAEVAIDQGRFRAGPFQLAEGARAFIVHAESSDGEVRELVHRVVRDSRAPRLSVTRPRPGSSVRQTTVELVGTAVDRHLVSLSVQGVDVPVRSGRFQHSLRLGEGWQEIELRAVDAVGHETVEKIRLHADLTPPKLWLSESASESAIEDGARYGRAVQLAATASEGDLRLTVDGQPWDLSQPIVEEGEHTVEMVSVDAAGNEARQRLAFTIDRSAPRFETVSGEGAKVSGRRLTLEGRALGAETVEVGGKRVTVGDDGSFQLPITLEEGSQSVDLVARDDVGNTSLKSVILKSDTTAPVVTISNPAADTVVASSPIAVSGTAVDADLAEVRLGTDIATLSGDSFTFSSVALVEGSNLLTVEAEDGAGNLGSSTLTVTLDTIAPTSEVRVDGTPLVDGAVFAGSITPEIITADASTVTMDATLDGSPYISGTTIETEGAHALAVTATDAAGNAATPLLLNFQTHQAPPVLLSIAPADGTLTALSTVSLSGTFEGADELTVAGATVPLLADGAFVTDPLSLTEGSNLFALVATGASGLSTTVEHSIVRDSTPPTLSVSSPAAGALVGAAAVDVSGTTSDAHSVQVVVNGVAASLSSTAFLARQVPLTEGANVLLVQAEDEIGNVREISRTVVSDTSPPVLTFTNPAVSGVVVPGPALQVEGTAVDPHVDRVQVNGETAVLAGDGSWSVEVPLQEGGNSLIAEAFDALGHRGEALLLVERDSAAPEVALTEPVEGWATTAATVDVRGTVADEAGITVAVNGLVASIASGTFEALAVPLADGENVLIARATDAQGNEGVDSLTVTRDNEAPSYLSSDPSNGALALGASIVFEVTFSEALASPGAGSYRLEADDGAGGWSELPVTTTLEGSSLRITPSSALPTQKALRLVLSGQLVDPAGNSLSNPTTLEFNTADTAAPGTPQVTAPAPYVCAQAVTLAGTCEPESRVVISGGAAPAEGVATASGDFSLAVELLPGLNVLSLIAIDGGGNASPASTVEVVRDCQAPQVLQASREGSAFRVVFDEPVQGATVAAAISLGDSAGPIAGSVVSSGTEATFTPSAALPAGDLLLAVSTQVSDLAGNTLAYPFGRWFEESLGESFFSGTVIDDATGRPLAGVKVSVTATDGLAIGEPRPELTTDDTGRFVLATAAGTHDVTFAQPGYSPVFRSVTTQVGSGAEVFDPRLTPVAATGILGASGGEIAEAGGVELTVPAGGLSGTTEISITSVSEQGLAALLPYGWSPRAAAWITIDPAQAVTTATLRLPVASPEGTLLTVAGLNLGTLQWHAISMETVAAGGISTSAGTVISTGAYVVLERDEGMAEPVTGEVLISLPAPSPDALIGASLGFDPELVLPNQRSRATVSYQTSAAVASGLPLTLEIQEQLELLDGSIRNEAPYRADLVLYRNLAGDSASTFWLEPSAAARNLPVRVGSEVVVVETYADEGVRGNVLGPSGGTVVNDEGDGFTVPVGALAEPTAVVLHRRTLDDLTLPVPRGVAIDGVTELELEMPLALPGTLSYALTPVPAGELGVLLSLVEIDGEARWRAQAALEPNATGWTTSPIDGQGLPWPGVTEAGIYAFARYTSPHGYAWGVMNGVVGSPLAGGIASSAAVDWVQLTDAAGRYVLPLPADGQTVTLRAENPQTGNVREELVTIAVAGEEVELGLPLQVVAPSVVSVVPTGGDVGVPLGVEPTIDFTEPVDPATLTVGIELLRDGVAVPIQFSLQGTLVRVLPLSPLAPETDYTLTVGLAVRDLQGYSLVSQHTATFQTAAIALPDSIDPRKLRVIRPDPVTGLAHAFGLAGSVPGEVAVLVENTSRPVATVSVTAAQDGSFALDIDAQLGDRLQLTVLIEGGTAPVLWLPPFLTPDLRSAYVGPRAEAFTTGEGITVTLIAETFDAPTWVRIEGEAIAASPRPAPDLLPAVSAFSLDFGGATANHALRLRLPAPADVGAGPHLLNRYVDRLGTQGWMMHDLLEVEGGYFVSSIAATGSSLQVPPSQFSSSASQSVVVAKVGEQTPQDYVTGAVLDGFYQVTQPGGSLGFLVVPAASLSQVMLTSNAFGPGTPMVGVADLYLLLFMPNGLIMPTLLDTAYELTVTDLTTGYELFRETRAPSSEPLQELPPDLYGDTQPPVLLGGSPLGLYHLQTGADGTSELGPGLSFEVDGTTLRVTGAAGTMVENAGVGLVGLDTNTFQTFTSTGDGGLSIERTIVRGERYLLTMEGRVHTRDSIVLEFSEALPEEVSGIQVRNRATEQLVGLVITPQGTRATQVLTPANGWAIGDYQLELTSELVDVAGNPWPAGFAVPFSVVGSSVGDSIATGSVQDVATLGSLLFVATLEDGLRIVDASDPSNLRNYLPGDLTFTLPLQEATRGVAIDPHGRVFVTGGGAATYGQLKILDPQAIDLAAIAADPAARDAAFRGSTLLSDPVNGGETVLPGGFPRRLAVMSNDDSTVWSFDPENPPAGVSFFPSSPPPPEESDYLLTLTVAGDALHEGLPVTLRNRTRGSWHRVDAGTGGSATFEVVVEYASDTALAGDLSVRPGDELELLRNLDTFAYVTIEGVGMAVVDANAFYGENVEQDFSDPNYVTQVLRYYAGYPVPPVVCDPDVPVVVRTPMDLEVLLDVNNPHPLALPTLIHRYGLGIMEATSLNAPADLDPLSDICAAIDNDAVMGGMAALQAYEMDLDGDGAISAWEVRDYVVVTNASVESDAGATGWVMVFDLTDRSTPQLVGQIELPSTASTIVADRRSRRLYVAGLGFGLYVVDFDGVPSLQAVDADGDGVDDRVLERIAIPEESVSQLALAPELGLIFAAGQNLGVSSVAVAPPQLSIVAAETGLPRAVGRVAPFGVPTVAEGNGGDLPGLVRIEARLPGGLANAAGELRLDLVSEGPGGFEIDGAGDPGLIADLPATSYRGSDGVVLRRLSDNPRDEGYGVFVSEPILLVADLRASAYYDQTPGEESVCQRCDLVAEGVYTAFELSSGSGFHRELLSGHRLAVRFPQSFRIETGELYGAVALDQAEIEVASVPWDISPAPRQEPRLNPAHGNGDVAPGTLLHSGEMTHSETDLAIPGRGFNFAFARTYRSGIVGAGPLGPGWDFGYRMRLRPLPNGDVEYFDGRGRRELFEHLGGETYEAPAGLFVELHRAQAGWLMISAGFDKFRFDRFGRLESISDVLKKDGASGNELGFFYDLHSRLVRITDTLHRAGSGPDRSIDLTYDEAGRLVKLTDFTDRAFSYIYDVDGRLTELRTPEVETFEPPLFVAQSAPLVKTYAYQEPLAEPCADADRCLGDVLNRRNNLTSLTDAKGQSWLSLSYEDRDGDARKEELASQQWGSGTVQVTYDFAALSASVVDRRGNICQYRFNDAGQATRIEDSIGEEWLFAYDQEGLLTTQTLPLGRSTTRTYDLNGGRRARGNALAVTVTPDSRGENGSSPTLSTYFLYHAKTNQPTRVLDPRGGMTVIERTEDGLETRITRAEGTDEESVSEISPDAHYLDYGRPVRQINPNGHEISYEYYPAGHASHGYLKQTVVDPGDLALETRYETDPRGNVVAMIDPRGVRSTATYNALDWPTQSRAAVTGSNDGAPPLNYLSTTRYDRNGNVSEGQSPFDDGSTFTRLRNRYGILDQLLEANVEVMPGAPLADWVTTLYGYDNNLNLVRVTDPEGNITETAYDSRNLAETVTRGLGAQALPEPIIESLAYDAERRPTHRTNGRGNISETRYDGFGRMRESLDPLGNRSTAQYDNHGNPTVRKSFGADGILLAESGSTYDLLNRVTESKQWLWEIQPEGEERPADARQLTTRLEYDAVSNLIRQIDPLGRVSEMRYDTAERPRQVEDAMGNLREPVYDPGSNVIELRDLELDPHGESVAVSETAAFDALGRQVSRSDALQNTTEFQLDARGLARLVIDPEGYFTQYLYDGLNRKIRETKPEGIRIDHGYDKSSRRVSYQDALSNETSWSYDALNRRTQVTYPDGNFETYAYDASHNLTERVDQRGTAVSHTYDSANRMTDRIATAAAGEVLEGPLVETLAYDGLNRLTRAQSGTVVTERGFDSLSRQVSDLTDGSQVSYQLDDAHNVTATTYPSGYAVTRNFDSLNRPSAVQGPSGESLASFGYRGRFLLQEKTLGGGISSTTNFDDARRPIETTQNAATGIPALKESFSWSPRNLKVGQSRGDLNKTGRAFAYDGAGRLTEAAEMPDPLAGIPNNAVPQPSNLAGEPETQRFGYDAAQNLVSKTELAHGVPKVTATPPDASGRNRPASLGGTSLAWDANGNLTEKGDKRFFYDFRNRLTRVTDDQGEEIARYTYDSFNRRVQVAKGGQVRKAVWDGWQAIEDYDNGLITSRRTFGLGLDEVVCMENDSDGDGTLNAPLVPLYDATGNLSVITGIDGKPLERYELDTFGQAEILVDATPPVVDQLRLAGGAVLLEMSEEVLETQLTAGVANGDLTLYNVTTDETMVVSVAQPIQRGRQARRRLMVTTTDPPTDGDEVRLTLEPAAAIDLFHNPLASTFVHTFNWAGTDALLLDTVAPQVALVIVRDGTVEIEFNEVVEANAAATAIQLDGAPATWSLSADGYTLVADTTLGAGFYELAIDTQPLDLDGRGLDAAFSATLLVNSGLEQVTYERPDPREVPESMVGNHFSFQGLPKDAETGLLYVRNRYYDPEMGRFITADPLGFVDGPSMYQFAGYDPFNSSDPMGLAEISTAYTEAYNAAAVEALNPQNSWGERLAIGALALMAAPMAGVEQIGNAIVDTPERMWRSSGGLIQETQAALDADDSESQLRHGVAAWGHASQLVLDTIVVEGAAAKVVANAAEKQALRVATTEANAAGVGATEASVPGVSSARVVQAGVEQTTTAASTKTVGRWMNPKELKNMRRTGRVQEGGGGQTRVADPADPNAFRNAPKNDVYVEFDVPADRVLPHSQGTGRIPGPHSREARIQGRNPADYEMPPATKINEF